MQNDPECEAELTIHVLSHGIEVRDECGLLVHIPSIADGKRLDHRRILWQLLVGLQPASVAVYIDPDLSDPELARAVSSPCLDPRVIRCSLTQETLPL